MDRKRFDGLVALLRASAESARAKRSEAVARGCFGTTDYHTGRAEAYDGAATALENLLSEATDE